MPASGDIRTAFRGLTFHDSRFKLASDRTIAGRYTSCMQIFLNGQAHQCAMAITIAGLLAATGHGERRVAVEVNREIVPRSLHSQHTLHEGDRVEIVQAIGGG